MKKVTYKIFTLLTVIIITGISIQAQSYTEIIADGWGKGLQNSKPTFADIDNDGLLDLLIGNSAYGTIFHYEQSSVGSTTFDFITYNFNNIMVGSNAVPVFTDIDNDGLLDLIIGEFDGNLNHYEQASSGSETFNLITENFSSIDVGYRSSPSFTDLDHDGLLNLIIGLQNGTLHHYEQTSTGSATFTLLSSNFNGIDVGYEAAPTFIDMNNNGQLDLVIGASDGTVSYYEQVAGEDTPTYYVINHEWGYPCAWSLPNYIIFGNQFSFRYELATKL